MAAISARLDRSAALALLLFAAAGSWAESVDQPSAADGYRFEVMATGARISGANGIHFAPNGNLYVASVVGSELLVIDPKDGAVLRRYGHAEGVDGPDDVAFAPDGAVYWTSILTGDVAGFRADGTRVVAGKPGVGVNPITFSPDGRLFAAQCFFGTGLYELDPTGVTPPRVIRDDLGPQCGLNGMDWGPDGRLYGPRWFRGTVVSIDVDTGAMRNEIDGLGVPAAVKFDSKGQLHVLDTLAGTVLRVERNALGHATTSLRAQLPPGLDNFAFDAADRLFVSSFADGFVARVEADGTTTMLSPGGMASPGGIAVRVTPRGAEIVVADLHALRGFAATDGAITFADRNVLGVSPLGSSLNVAVDGEFLILASWVDNTVRVWDPAAKRVVESIVGLEEPVAAVRFGDAIVITEHRAHRVVARRGARATILAAELPAPTGLVVRGDDLFLTDRARGELLQLIDGGEVLAAPRVVAAGLASPEGVTLYRDGFAIVEAATGAITYLAADGSRRELGRMPVGLPAGSAAQPPSFVFNGIGATPDGALVLTDERSRSLVRLVEIAR